jgi:hypothetical protein
MTDVKERKISPLKIILSRPYDWPGNEPGIIRLKATRKDTTRGGCPVTIRVTLSFPIRSFKDFRTEMAPEQGPLKYTVEVFRASNNPNP